MEPQNFSFLDDTIAGSAIPEHVEHLQFYKKNNIKHVISLTGHRPLVMYHNDSLVESHHLPVYSTPAETIIQEFLNIVRNAMKVGEKVVIHCQYGQERTGMLLVIYLIEIQGMSLYDAMDLVKEKRPSSLKTYVANEYLNKRYS